ncbi:hypothetical protein [Paludisphaera rhizosphaerae]|uniref:hypothetical protein n=1 Tax=Paludisphaera rhizosphaerae TaxID=2711216 RepID=UPI0013ECFF81|nr:hypothetical protein [Paludisphaera rhizosphaerae]
MAAAEKVGGRSQRLWGLIELGVPLIGLVSIYHVARTRSLYDCLIRSAADAVPFLVVFQLVLHRALNRWRVPSFGDGLPARLICSVGATVLAAVCGALFYFLAASTGDVADWYLRYSFANPTVGQVSMCLVLPIIGGAFYLFRKKAKVVYGMTEVAAGIYAATSRIFSDAMERNYSRGDIYLILLTAGVYLIVRGYSNIEEGLRAGPEERDVLFDGAMQRLKPGLARFASLLGAVKPARTSDVEETSQGPGSRP